MRILAVEEDLTFHGGQERSYVEMCAALADRGHHVALAYRTEGDASADWSVFVEDRYAMSAAMVRREHPVRSAAAFARSARSVARARPDVVYVNQYQDTPLAALVAARRRAPLVCHLRQPIPLRWGLQWSSALARVAVFIAVSRHLARSYESAGLPPERIEVVPLGIDGNKFAPDAEARAAARRQLELTGDVPLALYAGRIDREKGLESLVAAWQRVHATEPRARLVLAGAPRNHASTHAAREFVRELQDGAPPDVRFLPRQADMAPLYAAADVVVLPSTYGEPAGRVLLEAMGAGVPVVASDTGGIPEYVGPCADLLTRPGDDEHLAATLLRALRWRTDDPTRGERCRAHVLAQFPLDAATDRVEALLAAAVNGSRDAAPAPRRVALWRWRQHETQPV